MHLFQSHRIVSCHRVVFVCVDSMSFCSDKYGIYVEHRYTCVSLIVLELRVKYQIFKNSTQLKNIYSDSSAMVRIDLNNGTYFTLEVLV